MTIRLSRPLTSPAIVKAQARASKQGWNPAWVRTELDARAVLDAGCWYDERPARRVVNFFHNVLRHVDSAKGVTGPFRLMPWQRDEFILPLFGWVRSDGTRRYRRGGLWVPKKNGKSTMTAGLELYMLVGDEEPAAEVYSAANDRSQAGIIHGHAMRMVELSPLLLQRITKKGLIRSTKTIYDKKSGSTFKALSADAPTKEGLNIHALIVDEIHAMKSRVLWDTLIYGGAARRQPLILSISTAGVYDIASIGWEQYRYARDIATGVNDRDWSFFSLIYEAAQDEDWTQEATWRKANPSYGATVKIDGLREECTEAQADPQKENTFRRYRLNQWVQQATRWIPLELWDANNVHPVDRAALRGRRTYCGVDIGAVRDLTCAAYLTQCPHDPDAVDITARFWCPEDALSDPRNPNAVLYQQWKRGGFLETTPRPTTDYDFVEARILEDAQFFDLRVIGIDRLFQGQQVQNHLEAEGLTVLAIGQGYLGQAPPMKEFERLWRSKKIHHGGHPILRWMADNTEVKPDPAGNLKITKPKHHNDPRKVDGIQAIVNAVDPLTREVPDVEPQYQVMFFGPSRRR